MEYCNIPGDAIDPIEGEAVKVNVKIGGGYEALYKRHGAGGGLRAFQSHLFDQDSCLTLDGGK